MDRKIVKSTETTYEKIETNLREFFGEVCELEKITRKRADDFAAWLRTEPLNRRRKGVAEPYSQATINRRISQAKQLFHYARRIGWIAENPFEFIKGGASVNPERWEYVEAETVETIINASHLPKWRAILALGRFAGTRGSSELYGLLWEHVKWSSPGEPGQIVIKAEKNKRHGRQFRTIPMHPTVERELTKLFEQAAEKEPHVFPGMKKQTNFSTMTEKLAIRAGLPIWQNPWYNLRKSFCCDLMEAGIDPVVYEAITDHSYHIAMKHYQIPHTKRLQKGYEKVFAALGCAGMLPKESHPNIPTPEKSVQESVQVLSKKPSERNLTPTGVITQRNSQVPIFSGFTQERKNACTNIQAFELGDTGMRRYSLNPCFYGVW